MQMRYRYRIEPTPTQQALLARVFGCARVVFNDALRVRDEAYRVGIKLSDSQIQRQVITMAKTTEQRGWLAEVPSVALVQSVNDSRRAWRNFFDSATGKRKGRKVSRPRIPVRIIGSRSGSPATASRSAAAADCLWPRWARCGCAGLATYPRNPPASRSFGIPTVASTPASLSTWRRHLCRCWSGKPGWMSGSPGWPRSPPVMADDQISPIRSI